MPGCCFGAGLQIPPIAQTRQTRCHVDVSANQTQTRCHVDVSANQTRCHVDVSAGNGSANVRLIGGAGLLDGGRSPRDGISAVVTFTTRSGKMTRYPIASGDSYGSTNSSLAHFGLGRERFGTLDVLWPGGTKNRLYGVRATSRTFPMPEIPCSYDTDEPFQTYVGCVSTAVRSLKQQGILSRRQAAKVKVSAFLAYLLEH